MNVSGATQALFDPIAAALAGAALFLAGPSGAFVTGHTLVIDGGTFVTDGT